MKLKFVTKVFNNEIATARKDLIPFIGKVVTLIINGSEVIENVMVYEKKVKDKIYGYINIKRKSLEKYNGQYVEIEVISNYQSKFTKRKVFIGKREKDNAPTPKWFYDFINELGFVDVCIDPNQFDFLKEELPNKAYCNPPFSKKKPFIDKACEEAKKGKLIVMLLPFDPSTKWFIKAHEECKATLVVIEGGRLHSKRAIYPSMLLIFNNRKERYFIHINELTQFLKKYLK